ncbi:hypothetical protein EDD11_004411 [Mortierella claussenii]|nr:hypothetical protein EDD11_004411 [Mortierella claussenii]
MFASPAHKYEIIRYLQRHLRASPGNPVSSLVTLCRHWSPERTTILKALIGDLLPGNYVTWVPDIDASSDADPLAILLNTAETEPSALGQVRIVLDYCVARANRSRNLAFLYPMFRSFNKLMLLSLTDASSYLGQIAYVSVHNRSYIMGNHSVARPPWLRAIGAKAVYDMDDPILQLRIEPKPDTGKGGAYDKFTDPMFLASFDALWHYKDNMASHSHSRSNVSSVVTASTSWWRVLLLLYSFKVQRGVKVHVECHDFSLASFETLLSRHWCNTNALLQVYLENPSNLLGVFVTIIFLALCFIWLEYLQALQAWIKYKRSQLRIQKSICKYVTVIQLAFVEIKVFFVIFAATILAFAIGFVHLLLSCPTERCRNQPVNDDFLRHFFGALSATYFFLVTSLISVLINGGFQKGDEAWRLAEIAFRKKCRSKAKSKQQEEDGRLMEDWEKDQEERKPMTGAPAELDIPSDLTSPAAASQTLITKQLLVLNSKLHAEIKLQRQHYEEQLRNTRLEIQSQQMALDLLQNQRNLSK